MVTYKVHFIRHGLTQGNLQGLYAGRRTDLALCGAGIRELEFLKAHFSYPAAELVVSGPLRRCVQTAELLYPDAWTQVWEPFTECDFGEFEGKPVAELGDDARFRAWLQGGMREAPPGGESSQEVARRAVSGLHRLFDFMMQERLSSAAVITHSGVMTSLLYGVGVPKLSLEQCAAGGGRGYTVLLTPQLWMRDRAFEIYGVVPYGLPQAGLAADAQALERLAAHSEGGTDDGEE